MFKLLSRAAGAVFGSEDELFDLATTETLLEELYEVSVDVERDISPSSQREPPMGQSAHSSRGGSASHVCSSPLELLCLGNFNHDMFNGDSVALTDEKAMREQSADEDVAGSFSDLLVAGDVGGRFGVTDLRPSTNGLPHLDLAHCLDHGDLECGSGFPIQHLPNRYYYETFSTKTGGLNHVFGHLAHYHAKGRDSACIEYPDTAVRSELTIVGESTLQASLISPLKSSKDITREAGRPVDGESVIFDDIESLGKETVATVAPVAREANVNFSSADLEPQKERIKERGHRNRSTKKFSTPTSTETGIREHNTLDKLNRAQATGAATASSAFVPDEKFPKDQSVDMPSHPSVPPLMSAVDGPLTSVTTKLLSWILGTSTLTTDQSTYNSEQGKNPILGPSELVQEYSMSEGSDRLSALGPSTLTVVEELLYDDCLLGPSDLTGEDYNLRSWPVLEPSVLTDTGTKEGITVFGPSVLAAQGEDSLGPLQGAALRRMTGSQNQDPSYEPSDGQPGSTSVKRHHPMPGLLGWLQSSSLVHQPRSRGVDAVGCDCMITLAQDAQDAVWPSSSVVVSVSEEETETTKEARVITDRTIDTTVGDNAQSHTIRAQGQTSHKDVTVREVRDMVQILSPPSSSIELGPIEPPEPPVSSPPTLTKSQRKARNRRARRGSGMDPQASAFPPSVPQPAALVDPAAQLPTREPNKSNMKKLRRAGAKSTSKTDGQDLKTVNIVTERRKGQVVKHDISSKVLTLASVSNQAPLPFKIHIHSTIEAYSYASLVYASPQGPLVQEFGPHHLVMWTDGTNPVYSKRLQAFAVVYRTEPLILGQEQSGWHEWAFTGNVQSNKIITTLETMAVHNALGVAVREVSRHREKLDKAANHISKVTIFTDSQNTLTGLLTGNLGSLGASIVKYADMLVTKGITVDLRWVPSHATVPGNEAADRLALLASQFGPLPQNDAFVRVPVPLLRICARQFATAEVWCRGLNTAVVKPFLEVQKRELREALGRAGVEEGWGDLLV